LDQPIETISEPVSSDGPAVPEAPDWDPSICDDETLLRVVPVAVAIKVLLGENRVFQRMLFDFFPEGQQQSILQNLAERNLQIPLRVERNPFVGKMESSMKEAFLVKLRSEASQEINRE
jgi:hypothetical protein